MRILITPEISKKIVSEEEFKYEVGFGDIDWKLGRFLNTEDLESIQFHFSNGESKRVSIDNLAIHIIGKKEK